MSFQSILPLLPTAKVGHLSIPPTLYNHNPCLQYCWNDQERIKAKQTRLRAVFNNNFIQLLMVVNIPSFYVDLGFFLTNFGRIWTYLLTVRPISAGALQPIKLGTIYNGKDWNSYVRGDFWEKWRAYWFFSGWTKN